MEFDGHFEYGRAKLQTDMTHVFVMVGGGGGGERKKKKRGVRGVGQNQGLKRDLWEY